MTSPAACVPNIGPGQRKRRLIGGLVMIVVTLILAALLVSSDAPRLWRVLVAIPALGAALGVFQAKAQTCVALAVRGLRNMDDGDRAIGDQAQLATIRNQSRQVYVKAAMAALGVTAVVLAI